VIDDHDAQMHMVIACRDDAEQQAGTYGNRSNSSMHRPETACSSCHKMSCLQTTAAAFWGSEYGMIYL
jgi:hypothetical protein